MDKEIKTSNKCPICGRQTHKESKYCIFHASAEEKTEEGFKKALKEYIQEIKEGNNTYNFERFIFIGDINFKKGLNITIFKKANFENATFEGEANFGGATFKGDANFWKTTFKEDANFENATFKGEANFGGATFKGEANFWKTTFKGDANFRDATFKHYADFINATFKKKTDFDGATFEGLADFINATFDFKIIGTSSPLELEGLLDFIDTNLERVADFGKTTFGGNVNFTDATFKGGAFFCKTTFEGDADFVGATFEYYASFGGATFKGDANFSIKVISEINFANTLFTQGKTLVIKTTDVKNEVVIDFEKVCLENVYLELDLSAGTSINFTDALLRNTKIEKDQIENHILQKEQVYLLLKNNFHSIGKYEDESWAFKKEKDIERLSQSFSYYIVDLKNKGKKENFPILKWIRKGNFRKWIISAFSNMIFGYGERPWNVVKTSVVIIIIFALSFSLIGIGKPEIIELKGTGIYQNSGNIVDLAIKGFFENSEIRNFPDSLYFSLITFTTLGYGDFRPLEGLGRILAGSEAFLGAIMMALFVYTFARRTGGR